MKTLTLLLLSLSLTLPALAQSATERLALRVNNVNEPARHLEVYCQDQSCDLLRFVYTEGEKTHSFVRSHAEIERLAEMKLERVETPRQCWGCDGPYYAYRGTRKTFKQAKADWAIGAFGTAILGYLTGVAQTVGETAILPVTPITWYSGTYRPKRGQKKWANRVLKKIDLTQTTEINLRKVQYEQYVLNLQ